MPSKEIQFQLDAAGQEWLRMRFTTVRGQVTAFTVQYETTIGEDRVPVVRYDCAHGFAHRDLLDRRGRVIHKKRVVNHLTLGMAMVHGKDDIQNNWPSYRAAFLGDES